MYRNLDSRLSFYTELLTRQIDGDGERVGQLAGEWARQQTRQTIKRHPTLRAAYSLDVLPLISPPDYEMEN